MTDVSVFTIDQRISVLEAELASLKAARVRVPALANLRDGNSSTSTRQSSVSSEPGTASKRQGLPTLPVVCHFSSAEVERYSRQMLVPAFGAPSQVELKSLSVLIVGAGGLGCPAALYLAAAGVGRMGIVDDDVVAVSNLHRQVGHSEGRTGVLKAESLAASCLSINSSVTVEALVARFTACNGADLTRRYDIILDCTDNPGTRYLINDAAVLAGKPVVSGAAVGSDGQLSVYNYEGGPCYRCMFPVPPAVGTVTNCSDAGVLGPVVGVIGCLQALEVMKIAADMARRKNAAGSGGDDIAEHHHPSGSYTPSMGAPLSSQMLLFDGADTRFRSIKIRSKAKDCAVCGANPSISSVEDSDAWCAKHGLPTDDAMCAVPTDAVNPAGDGAGGSGGVAVQHVPASSLVPPPRPGTCPPTILDVREPHQFAISNLSGSINIPLSALESAVRGVQQDAAASAWLSATSSVSPPLLTLLRDAGLPHATNAEVGSSVAAAPEPVLVLCRRGVDSVIAAQLLAGAGVPAVNVRGGLEAYRASVDPTFPMY